MGLKEKRDWRNEKKKIVLKSFVDKNEKRYNLKSAREMLKKGAIIYCMATTCDNGREVVTAAVNCFKNLNTFETRDGIVYEIVDSENLPIRCDVVRYVNSETLQETYHEAIVQKWLQEEQHVTAFIVTDNWDAYRTSGIINVNWHSHMFLTTSGRRYVFS